MKKNRSKSAKRGWETRRRKKLAAATAFVRKGDAPVLAGRPEAKTRTDSLIAQMDQTLNRLHIALGNVAGRVASMTGESIPGGMGADSEITRTDLIGRLDVRVERMRELADHAESISNALGDFV